MRVHELANATHFWPPHCPRRYCCAQELRGPLLTLRAFNVETSLVYDHAKSSMMVMMRMQWWRDAVNAAYKGKSPNQPVMTALAEVLRQVPLTRYRLQRIITAREEDLLRTAAPESVEALESYAEGTASQLLYLQLEAAGIADAACDHVASHVGKAVGLAALLRGTYHHAQQQRGYLPAGLCAKHGVSPDAAVAGEVTPALQDVVHEVASMAKSHLDTARSHMKEVPPAARRLFLPSLAADLYFGALEKANFNPFESHLLSGGYSPLWYQLQLKYYMLRNKF